MSRIYLIFYRGKSSKKTVKGRLLRLQDALIRFLTKGEFSHCELAIAANKGLFDCYSASLRDGGVRKKTMPVDLNKWAFFEIPEHFILKTVALYEETQGAKYDFWGALSSVFRLFSGSKKKWFCSEWCAEVLGLETPEQYTPNSLFSLIKENKLNNQNKVVQND